MPGLFIGSVSDRKVEWGTARLCGHVHYCVGVFSSRKIQKRLQEDISFKVLAAGNEPDCRTISDFRKIHLKALEGLFEQVLKISLEAGAIKLGRVALDGTKVKPMPASTKR